jgi:hypothetical protein
MSSFEAISGAFDRVVRMVTIGGFGGIPPNLSLARVLLDDILSSVGSIEGIV